jgi:hypothetical protein
MTLRDVRVRMNDADDPDPDLDPDDPRSDPGDGAGPGDGGDPTGPSTLGGDPTADADATDRSDDTAGATGSDPGATGTDAAPSGRRPTRSGVAVATASGVAAVAGSFAAAGPTRAFVAAPVGTLLTDLTPGAIMAAAITTLGSLGQQLAFVGALSLTGLAFAGVAGVALRVGRTTTAPVSVAVPLTVAGGSALAYGLAGALVPALAAGVAGGFVVGLGLVGVPTGRTGVEPVSVARRGSLRAGVGAVAALALGGLVGGRRGSGGGLVDGGITADAPGGDDGDGGDRAAATGLLSIAADRSFDVAGLDPLVPATADHYTVDINNIDPDVAPDDWSLSVTGAVEEEVELSFAELTDLPMEHRFVTLRCVGEPLNGQKMDTALWTGVPVSAVMEQAGVTDDGCCVMFRAEDDFYEEFPLEALSDTLLAVQMNGEPLPRGHGRPVRALVPGHWGEINVKWLSEIEILERPADGYWEKKGWHGTGPVETVAKLHAVNELEDGRIEVAGHAYAGTRGIERVEVSTNGPEGPWTEVELTDPLPGRTPVGTDPDDEAFAAGTATDAWRMWRHRYEASEPHDVVVRATDGTGTVQPREERSSFPRGATGWVSKRVRL